MPFQEVIGVGDGTIVTVGAGVGVGGEYVADTVTVGACPLKGLEQPETSIEATSNAPTIIDETNHGLIVGTFI